MRIPVGDTFETWVQWLRGTFGAFFDLISGVLDFAISFLERFILLEHSAVYSSVMFGLFAGAVLYFLLRAKLGRAAVIAFAVVGGAAVLSVEIWRYAALEAKLAPEEAQEIIADLNAFASTSSMSARTGV